MNPGVDLGCGVNPQCEIGIDVYPYPGVIVCDLAIEPIPLPDNSQPYVRAYDFLEHIPVIIYWKEKGVFYRRFCRIELMKEIYRILKPGGIFESLTAYYGGDATVGWAQDPTHCGPPWTRETFNYFCGNYEAGVVEAYGIDFKFNIEEIREGGEHIFAKLSKLL